MADINVNGTSKLTSNSFNVPVKDCVVTFHSASAPVQICFGNSSTFGTAGIGLAGGGPPIPLTIAVRENTTFTVNASGTSCPESEPIPEQPYTISMDSTPPPHGHGERHD
jgi:hypothetical protein